MPRLPLRQRLLRGAFKYARALQKLRHQVTRTQGSSSSNSDSDLDSDMSLNADISATVNGSDSSSVSSLSSLSSLSSISSLSSLESDNEPGPQEDAGSALELGGLSDDSEDEEDNLFRAHLTAIHDRICYLETTRVLAPNKVHKLSQLYLVLVLFKEDDPVHFRHNLRVSPEAFDAILDKISWHPIFLNSSTQEQMPIAEQLAIALFRFGHFGNAASVESVAQWAGCSAGMVVNATRRVIQAILMFHDEFVHWPSSEEKEAAKEWVEAASCAAWRDGWVFVDGTLVPLSDKPGHHGEAYFDRKSNYSLNVQVCLVYFLTSLNMF
jgi:hypothetical protein